MHNFEKKQVGYTLLELLFSMLVFMIIGSLSINGLANVKRNLTIDFELRKLVIYLKSIRGTAASLNRPIITCEIINNECFGIGHEMISFTDLNNNRKIDSNEQIIDKVTLNANTISWRKNRKYIAFLENGQARGHNGTLKLCYGIKRNDIIISSTGRVRLIKNQTC